MHWELIAESLRQELAAYGGILHLFERQQRALSVGDLDQLLGQCPAIEALAHTLSGYRHEREKHVASFATEHGRPADSTLRSLLPLIDPAARPLLEALIDEVNRLLQQVRRASLHNHAVLARAVEVHHQVLLTADGSTSTASPILDHVLAETDSARTLRAAV